jgi:hypothetical protein
LLFLCYSWANIINYAIDAAHSLQIWGRGNARAKPTWPLFRRFLTSIDNFVLGIFGTGRSISNVRIGLIG